MDKQYEEMVSNAVSNGYSLERFQEVLANNKFSEEQINSLSEAYNVKKKDTTPSESQGEGVSTESTQSLPDANSSLELQSGSTSQGGDYALGQKQQELAQNAMSIDLNAPVEPKWSNIKEEEDYHRSQNNQEGVVETARRRQRELDALNKELQAAVTPGQKLAIGARKDAINEKYKSLTGDDKEIIDENGFTKEETLEDFSKEFKKVSQVVYDDVRDKALEKSEDMSLPLVKTLFSSITNMASSTALAVPDMVTNMVDPTERAITNAVGMSPSRQAKYDRLTYQQQIDQLATQYAMGIDEESINRSITEDFQNGDIEDGIKKVSIGVAQTIPQIAFTILAPEVSLPTMAVTSASQTWVDIQDRPDLSQEQKLTMAIVAGAAEYAFERIGMDEINKARKAIGIIDELPKSTRMTRAKDWISSRNSIAGKVIDSPVGSILGSSVAEGLEEVGVEVVNQATASLIAGDEFNPYQVADSFIVGAAAGGGTVSVPMALAGGFSAVGSQALLKDRVRIVNDIKKFKDLASNADLTMAERKELELELERANLELRELVDKEEDFYSSMNEADQNTILGINQKIRQKVDSYGRMKSKEAKDKLSRDVQDLLKEKQSIEKVYGDPFSVTKTADGKVKRKPYKDRKRAEKINSMLDGLGIGKVEETDESIEDSTVEYSESTDLDALVNEFLGDVTDAQLEKFGVNRSEIRQSLKETRNMFKALKTINPNSKVFIHKTPKAFENATGESALDSAGIFLPQEGDGNHIHLYAPALAAGTAIHELGHEIAGQMGSGFIEEYFNAMAKAVNNDPELSERYGMFLKAYLEEGASLSDVQEEFFAEFLQDLARGNVSVEVEKSLLNKFRSMINKYFNTDLKITDDRTALVEAVSRMAEKIAVGGDITDEAVLASVALEDGMNVAVVNASQSSPVKKKRKRQFINADGVETYTMQDVINRTNGRMIIITSDNTGVGMVDGKFVKGGLFYSFIPENIRDGVGFASVDESSVNTVMNFVSEIAPNGEEVAVFVMQQKPTAMLGNYYASRYFADALTDVIPKDRVKEVIEDMINTTKTSKGVFGKIKNLPTAPLGKNGKPLQADKKYGYGKKVGNDYYMEKTFMEEDMPAFVSKAAEKLPAEFDYKIVKFNDKTKEVSFIESKDFDTANEPTVGDSYKVKPNGDVKFTKGRTNNKQIYHHKWMMVRPTNKDKKWTGKNVYKGFVRKNSYERSIVMQEVMNANEFPTNKIGNQDFWSENVLPLIEGKYIDGKINWYDIGTWAGKNESDAKAKEASFNRFVKELENDINDGFTKEAISHTIEKMSFGFRNEFINLHLPTGYGKDKGKLQIKPASKSKVKGSLIKTLLAEKDYSQADFFMKESQPEFANAEELIAQLDGDWGYTYSGFITNKNLDYGKKFQEKGIVHDQFNAKIPSTENFLLDSGYEVADRFKNRLEYKDSNKQPESVRTSIAGSMFMGTRSAKAQSNIVTMANALLGGEKEGLSTQSILKGGAKKRKRVLDNRVQPSKEGAWYSSRDFESVINQFPDLYKESLDADIDKEKFVKENNVISIFHGGLAFSEGKPKKTTELSFYASSEQSEAKYYAEMEQDKKSSVVEIFVSKNDVVDENVLFDIMLEMDLRPEKYPETTAEEGYVSEWLDPRNNDFYSLSKADRSRLFKEVSKRGIKVIEIRDGRNENSPKYPADVINYIIVDPSVDANTSIEEFANAKDINLDSYMISEASGTGNETQVTTNNGTYQKMIDFFKGLDKNFKKKTFADINGGLGTSNQLKYANGIENYQVIEPFYDKKRFPVYSMTMEDANKAVKLLSLKETAKPHGELNKYVKKNDENFTRFEELVKKGLLPSSKLKPDYTEQNGYDIPNESIDYAMSNAVLNVIPGDVRQDVVLNFGRALKVGGVGVLSTRGTDVATNKSNVSLSEDPLEFYVASKYSYQKGFTPNELQAYIQDVLGSDFEVERYNKLSGPAVVIKRVDNSQDLSSKFVYQKDTLQPKKRISAQKVAMISSNLSTEMERGLKAKGYNVDKVYNRNSTSTLSNYQYLIARKGSSDVRLYAIRVSDHSQAGSMEIYGQPFTRVDDSNHELFKQFKRDTNMNTRFSLGMTFNAYDYESYARVLQVLDLQDVVKAGKIKGLWNRYSRKTAIQDFINSYALLPEEGRDKAFENMIYELGFDRDTAKEFTKRVSAEYANVDMSAEGIGKMVFENIMSASKQNNTAILDKFFDDVEESIKSGKKLEDILEKYKEDLKKGATKDELSVRAKAMMERINKSFLDRQANIKKGVREANLEGIEDLIVTKAGGSAWSKVLFNRYEKAVYKGLSRSELDALDKIIFARRVIQIDTNFDSREKDRPKHPMNFNKEEAEASLRALRIELGTEVVEELEKRADEYFNAMRDLFSQAYEEGLITEGAYNALKSDDYAPRKFLNFVLNPEDGTFRDSDMTSKQFFRDLESGSEESLIMDSRYLLQVHTRNTQNKIFTNRLVRSLALEIQGKDLEWAAEANTKEVDLGEPVDLSEPGEESFMYQPTEDKILAPDKGFVNVYYFEGGKMKAIQMNRMYRDELLDLEILAKSQGNIEQVLGALNTVLRFNATGAGNPLFFMKDFFRNWLYAIFRSDVYGRTSFTLSSMSLMKDLFSSYKDKIQGREDYIELAKHGGLMDFLAIESSPYKNLIFRKGSSLGYLKRGVKEATDKLTYMSETTETAFRVAIYKRDLQQRIKDFQEENGHEPSPEDMEAIKFASARASREILDFGQGGLTAKSLDRTLAPYLNVAIQGTKGMVLSIKDNPVKFMSFMTELGGIAAALTYLRLALGADDDDDVAEYDKRKNFIIWLGEKKTVDENGNPIPEEEQKREYLRIPKAEQLAGFLRVFEMMVEKEIKGDGAFKNWTRDDWKAVGQSFSMFLPVSDVKSFVPAWVQSISAYGWNYDMFKDQAVAYDYGNIMPQDEGVDNDRIEYFYKALGSALGASPARMKAANEKMVTTPQNSVVVSLAYGIADFIAYGTTDLGEEIRSKSKKTGIAKMFQGFNPSERFIRKTNPKAKMYQDDMMGDEIRKREGSEAKMVKLKVEKYIGALLNGEMTTDEVYSELKDEITEPDLLKYSVYFIRRGVQKRDSGINSMHWDISTAKSAEEQAYYLVKHFNNMEDITQEVGRMRQFIGYRPAPGLKEEIELLLKQK